MRINSWNNGVTSRECVNHGTDTGKKRGSKRRSRGARPRKMDFDQPVDDERGATSGRGGGEKILPRWRH